MWAWLAPFAASLLGSAAARVMTGAGFAVATFAAIYPLTEAVLSIMASHLTGLPAGLVQLIQLSGLGLVMSMIGSAVLTRATIAAALVGVKKA